MINKGYHQHKYTKKRKQKVLLSSGRKQGGYDIIHQLVCEVEIYGKKCGAKIAVDLERVLT